jgi:hypothetical protein
MSGRFPRGRASRSDVSVVSCAHKYILRESVGRSVGQSAREMDRTAEHTSTAISSTDDANPLRVASALQQLLVVLVEDSSNTLSMFVSITLYIEPYSELLYSEPWLASPLPPTASTIPYLPIVIYRDFTTLSTIVVERTTLSCQHRENIREHS